MSAATATAKCNAIKWVAIAIAVTNGYPTHSMMMPLPLLLPLPLMPPKCEHSHCILGNPFIVKDAVAVAVAQFEQTFKTFKLIGSKLHAEGTAELRSLVSERSLFFQFAVRDFTPME